VRPTKELKRFRRIALKPGEKRTVTFTLEKDAFAFYDEKTEEWIVEPGEFKIMVGSSSADIRISKMLTLK
jgi:beta-glucosidase